MNQHAHIFQPRKNGMADIARFIKAVRESGQTPFGHADTTAGMEYELQVAVTGDHRDVDLPLSIRSSTFFRNLLKRTTRGDMPPQVAAALQDFLFRNPNNVWENSWVRFDEGRLSPWTAQLMAQDMLADKSNPNSRKRSDLHRFRVSHRSNQCLRVPVSYLLKLALANVISGFEQLPPPLLATGTSLLNHFLSDNTSPEILSFAIQASNGNQRIGDLAASESARTNLFCQLLVQYANTSFGLNESGQHCQLYSAPHAPVRQKQLNEIVPDGYYRHLFMSPCLSGWDRGEDKHRYMELCHRTLSRSQLNTIGKLREAGIVANNLIVLPNTSTTCLANNGTHVSLGSSLFSAMAAASSGDFTPSVEKYSGDLATKIIEHFLPLFVGTYSAAPYRIDFADFHPEKVLGFLPHELDYTHLRMIWRRWRKKAAIRVFGKTVTPFGPRWLDRGLASLLRLKGDLAPDYRLVDYLVTLMSTDSSPALNGAAGNHEQLKDELAEMGIFDPRMSIYLPYRQRLYHHSGYCGFEGRSHSLFPSLATDMAEAVDLQNLITALACRYILDGRFGHLDIPDTPSIESERRQVFFACAVGIPTFYVRSDTGNRFLRHILSKVTGQRQSGRYKGYIRVSCNAYRLALLAVLEEDGAPLIEQLGAGDRLAGLRLRLRGEAPSALDKIIAGVTGVLGTRQPPINIPAHEFNTGMEKYFRTTLKAEHIREGLAVLADDCNRLDRMGDRLFKETMAAAATGMSAADYIGSVNEKIVNETAEEHEISTLLRLALTVIHHERNKKHPL